MSYSHRWKFDRPLNPQEWSRICSDVRALLNEPHGIHLGNARGQEINDVEGAFIYSPTPAINFNGVGRDSQDPFLLKPETLEQSFKTHRKPYDELAAAAMLILAFHKPSTVIESSGGEEEWARSWQLARHILKSQHPLQHQAIDAALIHRPGAGVALYNERLASTQNAAHLERVDAWLEHVQDKVPEDAFAVATLNTLKKVRRELACGLIRDFDARYATDCLEIHMRNSRFVEPSTQPDDQYVYTSSPGF